MMDYLIKVKYKYYKTINFIRNKHNVYEITG